MSILIQSVDAGSPAQKAGILAGDRLVSLNKNEIRDVLAMVRTIHGGRRLPVLPTWMARMGEPFLKLDAKRKKERPLYTSYSLYTLKSNDRFSHDRATRELGYYPRDLYETLKDTVAWLCGRIESLRRTAAARVRRPRRLTGAAGA